MSTNALKSVGEFLYLLYCIGLCIKSGIILVVVVMLHFVNTSTHESMELWATQTS
jgi:hypothetical protein